MKQPTPTRDDPPVEPYEWRWVCLASVVALLVISIPYALAWVCQTPARVFSGFNFLMDDAFSYLAKMRQGAEGAWLFHIAYTPEPHPGTLFFPFHLLLGKVAALLPGPENSLTTRMVWTYHVARMLFGLGLSLTTYRFLAEFTAQIPVRRLAWLMVVCGGGLGWLLVALGQSDWLGSTPLDFYLPEGFAFLTLYAFPHIALAQSLLLGGILFLLRAWGVSPTSDIRGSSRAPRITFHVSRSTFHAATAGVCWFAMGFIVPFYVAVAWAVTGAAWLTLTLREHRLPWREGLMATAAALIPAPVVAYSAWVFTTDPVYATWAAQNRISSPHPLHYLAAYGVPLTLAAFAVRDAWRDEGPTWLALAWVGVAPLLVYLPFNLQRRMVEGVQVPLSLLAAAGAVRVWESGRRWLVMALLALMIPTYLVFLAGSSAWMLTRPPLVFRDAGEVAALDWLAGQVRPDDVVLAAYETGNYLPARVGARAFLGHGLETVDAAEKEALVARFFDATTDDAWRQRLLARYGVDVVFWGPAERALGTFDPRTAPYLRQVYAGQGYEIFEVER
mgnify:CR=1 FL=1